MRATVTWYGQYAADPGTRTNFGFNVKYNSSLTNLQGHANIIFRRTNPSDGLLHTYQIMSSAINSLGVNPATPNQAQFSSKANLQDVTNPNSPISIAGNLVLQMNITDNGNPGTSDTIAISLSDTNGGTYFSSNWNGKQTVQQNLAGGNLVVHNGSPLQALGGTVGGGGGSQQLTRQAVGPIVAQALTLWAATGIAPERLSAVPKVDVQVGNLPAPYLGLAFPGTGIIWIDQNAAGYGWFIDSTPADDAEFAGAPNSPAQGRMDLLSVVSHEIGHLLGFDHDDGDDVMAEALAPGVRRVPEPSMAVTLGDPSPAQGLVAGQQHSSALAADVALLLTAAPLNGTSLASFFVDAGQKQESGPLSYQPPVLPATGQGVDWILVAQETHQAPAKMSSTHMRDHVFAEESSLLDNGLLSDLALALEG